MESANLVVCGVCGYGNLTPVEQSLRLCVGCAQRHQQRGARPRLRRPRYQHQQRRQTHTSEENPYG